MPNRKGPQCALVIGHSHKSQGAANAKTGMTEFQFNEALSMDIAEALTPDMTVVRVYRDTYSRLPGEINALNPDFIVSLHCNAFYGRASGTETLYFEGSNRGLLLAKALQRHLVDALKLPNRGVKPSSRSDRGGYLLAETNAPCVIAEPFFIDNDNDFRIARENIDALVGAYAAAIKEFANLFQLNGGR